VTVLSFFSLCSRHLRDLHSFPTRRSSDLTGAIAISRVFVSPEAPSSGTSSESLLACLKIACAFRSSFSTISSDMTLTETCFRFRSEEHTSELQSRFDLVCRLLLEKKNKKH